MNYRSFLFASVMILAALPNILSAQWMNILKTDSTQIVAEYIKDSANIILFRDHDGKTLRILREDILSAKPFVREEEKPPVSNSVSSSSESAGKKRYFQKGSMEFTLSGTGGEFSESRTGSVSEFASASSSITYIDISFMPAYYIIDGLSIEPEIVIALVAPDSGPSSDAFSFLGNLAYTFSSPGSYVAEFIRAGYGISNGLQIPTGEKPFLFQLNEGSGTSFSSVSLLHLGVGLKFLIGAHAAIRTELFYLSQSYSSSSSGFSADSWNGMIGIQFGISLLP